MVIWSEKLYIGEQAEKNYEKIKKKIEQGKLVVDVFLITKPSNEKNLFDILPTAELKFPYYKKRELLVYGLAKGKDEAKELLLKILEDIYQETGGLYCKEYFKSE